MKSKQDLIHRALRNLGALPQGQSPASEDYQSVSDVLDSLVAELRERDVIDLPQAPSIDTNSWFDDQYLLPLGNVLANAIAGEFGANADTTLPQKAMDAEMKLQKLTREVYSGQLAYSVYF